MAVCCDAHSATVPSLAAIPRPFDAPPDRTIPDLREAIRLAGARLRPLAEAGPGVCSGSGTPNPRSRARPPR